MRRSKWILPVLLLLLLTGCGSNSIIKTENETIGAEKFLEYLTVQEKILFRQRWQEIPFSEEKLYAESKLDPEEVRKKLFQDLVAERAAREYLDPSAIEAKKKDLVQDLVEREGQEAILQDILRAYEITEEEFDSLLEREAILQLGREKALATHPISEEELNKYYEKHKEEFAEVSGCRLKVYTKNVGKALANEAKERSDVKSFLKSKETEGVSEYEEFEFLGKEDLGRYGDLIIKMESGGIDFFPDYDGVVYVYYITDKRTDLESLKPRIKASMEDEVYLDWLNEIIRESQMEMNEKLIPPVKEKTD